MATTTFADYQVLSGTQTTLDAAGPNDEVEFEFKTKDIGLVATNDFRRPVLAFHVRVHKESSLKIFVNSQSILSWTLGTDTTVKGLWQPWDAGTVLAQFKEPLKVRFLLSPTGKIDIANVVMWYQVRKDG